MASVGGGGSAAAAAAPATPAAGSTLPALDPANKEEILRVFQSMTQQRDALTDKLSELLYSHSEYKCVDGARVGQRRAAVAGVQLLRAAGQAASAWPSTRAFCRGQTP